MSQITDTVPTIRAGVANRLLVLRSFERQLAKSEFEIAFQSATDADKIKLNSILKSLNKQDLKTWIHQLVRGKLDYMTYRSLRDWAHEENIPYWSRMTREELIQALQKVLEDARRVQEREKPG